MTQKQRLRAAIDALYRDPRDALALADAHEVLAEAQNRPPEGGADGSIGNRLWARRGTLVRAFATIQEERQTLDETEDT